MLLVLFLSHAKLGHETTSTILAGIILTALANAALSLVLCIVSPNELHAFFFWFMGSFGSAQWDVLIPSIWVIAALSLAVCGFAWSMNALAIGDDFAAQVGINVRATKAALLAIASLLTAVAVSVAGTIGFVGLVVPHLVRRVVGVDHRKLLPLSAAAGAALCVSADVVARTLLAPNELPVGVVMAFIGVPVFLALLLRPA